MFSLFLNNTEFILGISLGLVCSVSLSLWKWNQAAISRSKFVEENMKKKKKRGEMKMAIVVRKDLKLTKLELLTQSVHGCIGAFKESLVNNPIFDKKLLGSSQTKVAIRVNDENELFSIQKAAVNQGLVNYLIRDPDSSKNNAQILCIGPDTVEDINLVTGHLKLY